MSDEGTRTGKTTINALQKAVSEAFIKYDQRRHYGHDTERAHREVQIAVFGLHQEISRYKFTNNLEEVWHESISDSVEESLDDLTYFRFADRQRAESQYNAVDAVWEDAAVNEPHVLSLRALQDISRQLDRCYHELGFDEVPKHVLSRRGTVGDSDPETRRSTAHVDVESLLVAEGLVAGPGDETGSQSWLAIKRANRQDDGRDLQTIITARNSSTGTGKTTLALWLALSWDRWGFDDTKTTLHPTEYKNRVIECKPGEVIIMDEAEQIDARRSMSGVNVDLSQMLMQTRYLQVDSIFTLRRSRCSTSG
jgi:hypothetical protein